MPNRLEINLDKVRSVLPSVSARSLVTDYGVSRALLQDINDRDVKKKEVLFSPFVRLVTALQGVTADALINGIEILTGDEFKNLRYGNLAEVDYVQSTRRSASGDFQFALALKASVEQIQNTKAFFQRNISGMINQSYERMRQSVSHDDPLSNRLGHEHEFFQGIDDRIFDEGYTYLTNSTALVADNSDHLEQVELALLIQPSSSYDDNLEDAGTLSALIEESKSIEKRREVLSGGLSNDQVQIFFAPILRQSSVDVCLTTIHHSARQTDVTEQRLRLAAKIPRFHNVIVISPPDKQMALVRSLSDVPYVFNFLCHEDLDEHPSKYVNGQRVEVPGVCDLLDACKSHVLVDHRVDQH